MATDNAAELSLLSFPPKAISKHSTNTDVRLYVYKLIRGNDADFDAHIVWEKARIFFGNGRAVLRFEEKDWVEQLGIHGHIVYREIEAHNYVNVTNESNNLPQF